MKSISQMAKIHLEELRAFNASNPILAKTIAMRILMNAGYDVFESQKAIQNTLLNKNARVF